MATANPPSPIFFFFTSLVGPYRNLTLGPSLSNWGQTTRYFCLLKGSLFQIRRLKGHKFLPCHGRETRQTTRCSLINHRLQFMTCVMSPELSAVYYYWQADVGGIQKIKHETCSFLCCCVVSLFRCWFTCLLTRHKIGCFWANLTPHIFPIRLLLGWHCVVWPRHKCNDFRV